ncbi:MAG: aspartate--tRNA(Asn) ligase, partial [Candidatus Aenigmarchaeota archaeon]|nr:aspartate--tRNA(Asn) ligase [Candidatus Aenigmarchaeota archaeon]
MDTRLDARFFDVRKPEISAIFQIRDQLQYSGREFLRSKGFMEITTPKIIASASEGGTDLFPISYFEKEAFLAQSPQLYKQSMMASGLDRVYEIATYFRAEQHNTIWHLNENTAFDLEMAFIESEEDVMDILEGLVLHVIKHISKNCQPQLDILKKEVAVPKNPPRLMYDECLKMLKGIVDIEWGEDISTEGEKKLGEIMKEKGYEVFFIKKYPLKIRAFYTMPDPTNPKLSNSFDLEYKGREISSGAQRIHLYDMLVKRIEAKGLNPENFCSYLDAFRFGMPPHGGFGLGIERLLMQILELPNIREAMLFPRDRKRLTP